MESVELVIIGAGQAGLSVSREVSDRGIDHIVLEKDRVGATWRRRWDSFCLVTPNWATMLPAGPYDGNDPDGYQRRDELVSFLERYANGFNAPVRTGIDVEVLEPEDGAFLLRSADGEMTAKQVVIATGAYQRPHGPPDADRLRASTPYLDLDAYRNPQALPPGAVLVIGSGQSGCQIAEELNEAGREVFLACGRISWAPRRMAGKDLIWWTLQSGWMDMRLADLPSPLARLTGNVLATGHGGGHDLNLRILAGAGVNLVGRYLGVDGPQVRFGDDLEASVAWGDEGHLLVMDRFRRTARELGIPFDESDPPGPIPAAATDALDLSTVGAIINTGGFRPDYGWVRVPGGFDELGFPVQVDGASTVMPGLYFAGVHFLRKRKSSLLCGIAEDAAIIANAIARHR
ncbi:MAG TPA: NAD(P)-binding domain-containing protein [Acidimicrobiia bacterium]